MQLQRIVSRSYLRITGFLNNRETVKQDFDYRIVPQYTHDDIAKPDFVAMVLQHDESRGILPEIRILVKLAVGYSFPPVWTSGVETQDLLSVHPMLDVASSGCQVERTRQ